MPHHNYLVSKRKSHALDQPELAHLLGVSQSTISRLELGDRHPSVLALVACHILFGAHPERVFPDLYRQVGEALVGQAASLEKSLRHAEGPRAAKKRKLLEALVERVNPSEA